MSTSNTARRDRKDLREHHFCSHTFLQLAELCFYFPEVGSRRAVNSESGRQGEPADDKPYRIFGNGEGV